MIDNIDFIELEPMKYYAPPSTWSVQKKKDNVYTKIFSGDWYGAEKKDGYFSQFIKDENGECHLLSRSRNVNGEFPDKYEWMPQLHSFFEKLPNGTCLLGELYLPSQSGSRHITTILGCLKDKAIERQEKGEKLHFYVFDILAWSGKSFLKVKAEDRFHNLSTISFEYENEEYIDFATYYSGKELWDKLAEILERDDEGVVITHKDGLYEPGKRPSKTTLKVKKEISETIDCFFTGRGTKPTKLYDGKEIENWQYWVNAGTDERLPLGAYYFEYTQKNEIEPVTKPYYYKWCGSLEIGLVKDEKVVPIGLLSGLTDELKASPEEQKGKVIEVSAMQIEYNNDGSFSGLRHAKMLGFREDKNWRECGWDQLEQ